MTQILLCSNKCLDLYKTRITSPGLVGTACVSWCREHCLFRWYVRHRAICVLMIQCAHDTQTATSVNQFGELAEEFPAATALSAVRYPLREPYPVNEKFTPNQAFKVCWSVKPADDPNWEKSNHLLWWQAFSKKGKGRERDHEMQQIG